MAPHYRVSLLVSETTRNRGKHLARASKPSRPVHRGAAAESSEDHTRNVQEIREIGTLDTSPSHFESNVPQAIFRCLLLFIPTVTCRLNQCPHWRSCSAALQRSMNVRSGPTIHFAVPTLKPHRQFLDLECEASPLHFSSTQLEEISAADLWRPLPTRPVPVF